MRIFLLGAWLLLTKAQTPPQTPQANGINFFSATQDGEIGAELSKEAERLLPLVRDTKINRYLYTIGERLRRSLPPPAVPFRFRMVNSKDSNSVGFPGGAIYIDRGLVELTSKEDE